MMLDMLGEAALRTLLLAVVVQFGVWLLRVRRAQLLLVTWTVVLIASLVMPALQWATPLRLPVGFGHPATWLVGVAEYRQQAGPAMPGTASAAEMEGFSAWEAWLLAAYLLVSSVMVVRLMVGVALSLRLLGTAAPIRLAPWPQARIRISRAVAAPVTVGNVILLPPDVVDWPAVKRAAVIAHECAHVARGDYGLLVVSQLNRALFWFSPMPWVLHRRLAALAELASDDHAMRVTGDRTGYAEILLEMGRRSGPLLRGLAMARAATLQYRIERVLSDRAGSFPASVPQRWMAVGGAAAIAVAAASPNFDPGVPSSPIEARRPGPALALDEPVPAQTVEAPWPAPVPRIGDALPSPPIAAPPPRAAWVPPSGVPVAARPASRPIGATTHPSPPVRPAMVRRPTDTPGEAAARANVRTVSLRSVSPGAIGGAGASGIPEMSHPPSAQWESPPRPSEASLLKVIDQQTCHGVYLPGTIGGPTAIGGPQTGIWGSLNMVRAKFFREANGKSWLKFYLGARDPVDLPMTVTGQEVEFTAGPNTSFKMLPQGTNHLTGTTQRPNGTVDFACGEVGAHLFDRKS